MVSLLKPGAFSTAVLGGLIGNTGASVLLIQLHSSQFQYSTEVEKVTGDGDGFPRFASNDQLAGRFILRGWAVAASDIRLLLIKNQGTTPITLSIAYATGVVSPPISDTYNVVVDGLSINHRVDAVTLGLVITGYIDADIVDIS